MTKKKLSQRKRRAETPVDNQADRILDLLERWLEAEPGRRVTVEYDGDGWITVLSDRRIVTGLTLTDSMAQIATAVAFDEAGR